jgi:hypothetical protein
MEHDETDARPVTRRRFLTGGVAAGIGVGLGLSGCSSTHHAAGTPTTDGSATTTNTGPAPTTTTVPLAKHRATVERGRVVRTEPGGPPDYTSYVTRPDLRPVGVTVASSSAFRASPLRSKYIFCAPKTPLAANPGAIPPGKVAFPPGATAGLMILDTNGDLVWFKPLGGGHDIPFNFRVQTYNGKPTLTWFQGTVKGGHAANGHYVLADDTYSPIARVHATKVPCDLHEFILTPEGTALHTGYDKHGVSSTGVPLVIGHAQEVDVASNELLWDWPCYPSVNPALSYTHSYGDYFHINSIALWPGAARNLLISSRNTCAIYLVDRATKKVIWRLGGKKSDFTMGPGTPFYFQHDARPLADGSGLSLFDDASQPCPEKLASGKVLALDHTTGRVTLTHRYLHSDAEFATPSQGNTQLLDNGGHVVGWGFLPFFSVYGPSSTLGAPLLLDGRFPLGAASYRTFLFDWTGDPPLEELRLEVRPAAGTGHFDAWVSWNGATEVASWQLRAGTASGALTTVATKAKRGFETTLHATREGATTFEVAALDRSGRTLAVGGRVHAAP